MKQTKMPESKYKNMTTEECLLEFAYSHGAQIDKMFWICYNWNKEITEKEKLTTKKLTLEK